MIREVNVSQLTDVVERLCIEANEHLPSDVKCAIEHCRACEDGEIAQGCLLYTSYTEIWSNRSCYWF